MAEFKERANTSLSPNTTTMEALQFYPILLMLRTYKRF